MGGGGPRRKSQMKFDYDIRRRPKRCGLIIPGKGMSAQTVALHALYLFRYTCAIKRSPMCSKKGMLPGFYSRFGRVY